MKPRVRVAIFALLFLALIVPSAVFAAPIGKISSVQGNVDVTVGSSPAAAAREGMPVNEGDILRAKSKSKAEVTFNDGNIIRIAQNTRLKITSYAVGEKKSNFMNLFRGKMQSMVKNLGRGSTYEVRTPTAVCGVRGTDFFSFFQNGVSGAIFKEGTGYGYNPNMPNDVKVITAGQAMVISTKDAPPVIKPATAADIEKHLKDTTPPPKEEGGKEEGKGQGGQGQQGSQQTGQDTSAPPAVVSELMEPPAQPPAPPVITPPPPVDLSKQIQQGDVPDKIPELEPEPEPEPVVPKTTFSTAVTLGALSGTLSGEIVDATNTGTLSLAGTYAGSLEASASTISGTLSDGSTYDAALVGMAGSYRALLRGIYRTGDSLGYLRGYLSGTAADGSVSTSGDITRTSVLGTVASSSDTIGEITDVVVPQITDLVPNGATYSPNAVAVSGFYTAASYGLQGILGMWSTSTSGGTYSSSWDATYGAYGYSDYSSMYYMLGNDLNAVVDSTTGHVNMSGSLLYLDTHYMGIIGLAYSGTYDPGNPTGTYESVGAGTVSMSPLSFYGYWGMMGCLFANDAGNYTWAASDSGIFGGLDPFWTGASSAFVAIGTNDFDPSYAGKSHYLWNTPIIGGESYDSEGGGESEYGPARLVGFTAGFWAPGKTTINNAARALYVGQDGLPGLLVSDNVTMDNYTSVGMWKAEGTLTPYLSGDPAGYYSYDYGELTNAKFSGHFNVYDSDLRQTVETGSILGAQAGYGSETLYLMDMDTSQSLAWGIYNLRLGMGNTFSDKPTDESGNPIDASWSAILGGRGQFGYNGETELYDEGYWFALAGGTWSSTGEVSGDILGGYLTERSVGIMYGPFTAVNDSQGSETWIGQSIGVYEGDPLLVGGTVTATLYAPYEMSDGPINIGSLTSVGGTNDTRFGSASAPWNAGSFLIMGASPTIDEYYRWASTPLLWSGVMAGSNPQADDTTFFANTAGIWLNDSPQGYAAGIYLKGEWVGDEETGSMVYSNAGLLAGAISGNNYYDIGIWGAVWTVAAAPKTLPSLPQGAEFNLAAMPYMSAAYGSFDGADYSEIFASGPLISRFLAYWNPDTGSPEGVGWGIYRMHMEGGGDSGNNYSGKPVDEYGDPLSEPSTATFRAGAVASNEGSYILADLSTVWNADGTITGALGGTYLGATRKGTLSGPFYGTYLQQGYEPVYGYDGIIGYGGYGGWVGAGVGTFEGENLLFSGSVTGPSEGGVYLYYNDYANSIEEYWGDCGEPVYPIQGRIGSTSSLFTGLNAETGAYSPAPFLAMGTYHPLTPPLFRMDFSGQTIDWSNGWSVDGDAVAQFTFAGVKTESDAYGLVIGLYQKGENEVGYITSWAPDSFSSVHANLYSTISMWEVVEDSSSLYATRVPTDIYPAWGSPLAIESLNVEGALIRDLGEGGRTIGGVVQGQFDRLQYQSWGIISGAFGGDGSPSSFVSARGRVFDDNNYYLGFWRMDMHPGEPDIDSGVFTGTVTNGSLLWANTEAGRGETGEGAFDGNLVGTVVEGSQGVFGAVYKGYAHKFGGYATDYNEGGYGGFSTIGDWVYAGDDIWLQNTGSFEGIIGSTDTLFGYATLPTEPGDAYTSVTFKGAGAYDNTMAEGPKIFSSLIVGGGYSTQMSDFKAVPEGGYGGYLKTFYAGRSDGNTSLLGDIAGVYVRPTAYDTGTQKNTVEIGFLNADNVTAGLDPLSGTWAVTGSPTMMATLIEAGRQTSNPGSLVTTNIDTTVFGSGTAPSWYDQSVPYGRISLSADQTSHINVLDSAGNRAWGVSSSLLAGFHTGDFYPKAWTWEIPHTSGDLSWVYVSGAAGGDVAWDTTPGTVDAVMAGAAVDWASALTMVQGGTIKGVFDPAGTTWRAAATAIYMETKAFLEKLDGMSEAQKLAFEKASKIPAFEVGRVNLTGTHSFGTGDNLSVNMNNVQFFKNSTSSDPKIWATKEVAGSYTTTAPIAGVTSVPLSATGAGGTNFNVNFKFQQWNNTTTNTWGATVNGAGTLKRTDGVGGTDATVGVTMNGGAAGKINTDAKTFSGTGAGIAKPLQTTPPVQ